MFPPAARVPGRPRAWLERGNGELLLLTTGPADDDAARLRELFTAARADEWAEFTADCGKFTDEIAKEIAKRKFTLAELEEEEQSLDRLRRWFRAIRSKDVFGSPEAASADHSLAGCAKPWTASPPSSTARCTHDPPAPRKPAPPAHRRPPCTPPDSSPRSEPTASPRAWARRAGTSA